MALSWQELHNLARAKDLEFRERKANDLPKSSEGILDI